VKHFELLVTNQNCIHEEMISKTEKKLVSANVPSLLIIFTLMIKTTCSFEMSVLTGATWRHIPEDGILQAVIILRYSYCRCTDYFGIEFILLTQIRRCSVQISAGKLTLLIEAFSVFLSYSM
jgi:hypothetical protein